MVFSKRDSYDLVVIGAGPSGTPLVMEYATLNPKKSVLLIDKKGHLGGECLFDGCIPSKLIEFSGNLRSSIKKFSSIGSDISQINFDWQSIVQRKEEIIKIKYTKAEEELKLLSNIELIKGEAKFVDMDKIEVIDSDNGIREIIFKKAVIGTGSKPFIPNFQGNGVNKIWTNDTFFDKMELPSDLTIIGDGPIGIEFTQFLANLGVKVNLIGNRSTILPQIDTKYADIILKRLKSNSNINLILNVDVKKIDFDESKNNFHTTYWDNNLAQLDTIKSSKVLVATGRIANIDRLNLESAGIKFNKKGIEVNEYLQTSNKRVYALGDSVSGFPKFAHTAFYGAHIVSQNLFFERNKVKVDFSKNSWVLFAEPNFVQAGLGEKEAKELGYNIIVGEYEFASNSKSLIELEKEGYLKFVVNRENLQILGISILNESGHSISGEAALIVSNKNTLYDLVNSIHPHPTVGEAYSFLAKQMMGEIMRERLNKPLFKFLFNIKKYL